MLQDDFEPCFVKQIDAQESSAGLSSTHPLQVVNEARLHLEPDWAEQRVTGTRHAEGRKRIHLQAKLRRYHCILTPNKVIKLPYTPAKA